MMYIYPHNLYHDIIIQVGNILLERQSHLPLSHTQSCILHKQLAPLEYLATCMHIGWMAILVSCIQIDKLHTLDLMRSMIW